MAKNLPFLPPEIWRIVVSYIDMDRHDFLALCMASRFCARIFAGLHYNYWEVDCCSTVQNETIRESNEMYNSTNMDGFFRAVKSGFAPAYAKKVHFYFCMHTEPVNHAESCSKKSLQTNWPLKQTGEFLKLLNASEIVVIIKDPHQLGYICNEPFLRALLSESLCVLPNAVVKLRVDNQEAPGIDPGTFYFTIRDSSTSQAAVADNLQRALSQIRPSSIDHDLWDASELCVSLPRYDLVGIYPNVADLTLTHGYVSKDMFPWKWVFFPRQWAAAWPQCQRFTCRWETFGCYDRLEITYCLDKVLQEYTKILVHGELCKWVLWHIKYRERRILLDHVKEIEFHHEEHDSRVGDWPFPYTSSTLNALLACLPFFFPGLERMVLKFAAGTIIVGPNHPGKLSKGFCDNCNSAVEILEFDITTMLEEGSLHAVDPNSGAAVDLVLKVWQDESIDEIELSEFSTRLKEPLYSILNVWHRLFRIDTRGSRLDPEADLFRIDTRGSHLDPDPEPVPPYVTDSSGLEARIVRSKPSGLLRAYRGLKTRVRLCIQRLK